MSKLNCAEALAFLEQARDEGRREEVLSNSKGETGKLKVLYKNKPLTVVLKDAEVTMGSSSNSMFAYSPSVKVSDVDAIKLVEFVTEVVCNLDYDKDVTTRVKEYNDRNFLDLKLYESYLTVRTKEGFVEETLGQKDLESPLKVNKYFKVGSKVSALMTIGVWVSDKYVSVTASLGSQIYVDQRMVKTHFSFSQLKELFDVETDDEIEDVE